MFLSNSTGKGDLVLPKFSGSFHKWEQEYFTDRNNGLSGRFLVFSSGKRGVIHKYLWFKLVWDNLSREEFELFLSMPETLRNNKLFGFLQSLLIKPKGFLRQRLNNLEALFEEKVTSSERYRGYKRIHLEIHRIERNLPKVPKYSGYVKSPSSVGSKNQKKVRLPEPTPNLEYNDENQIDWFHLLTVDEIPFKGYSILNDPNEAKRLIKHLLKNL